MSLTLTLTEAQTEALCDMLQIAYEDQEQYLQSSFASSDYGDEWPEAAATKAHKFRRVGEVVEQLGLVADDWTSLAETLEAAS